MGAFAPHLRRYGDVVIQPRFAIDHAAQQPVLNRVAGRQVEGRAAVGKVDKEAGAGALHHIINGLGIYHAGRQGFFLDQVGHARFQGRNCRRPVEMIGGGNNDQIQLMARQHLRVIGKDLGAQLYPHLRRHGRTQVAHCHQGDGRVIVEKLGMLTP